MNRFIMLTSVLIISLLIAHARLLNADTGRDPDLDIRLRFAIVEGNIESVKCFLEQGADANILYQDGATPIAEAINKSRAAIDIIRELMQYGADPEVKSNGISPISLAIKKNNEELIQMLLSYAKSDAELCELALFYRNKENEWSALEYADEALKLNPFNVKAWELKGSIFLSRNNIKDAEMAYHNAFKVCLINLKKNKSEDNYKIAVWYALLSSNFNEALRVANEGLLLFPEDGNLRLSCGHAMLLLGRKTEATSFYKKAYADLRQSGRYTDRAGNVMADEFANLISRYPDQAAELKWAEDKIQEPFDLNFDEIPFGKKKTPY